MIVLDVVQGTDPEKLAVCVVSESKEADRLGDVILRLMTSYL